MKTLALLSGKGGSGKTTLGLTMSSVLSKAGVNVLLVDCDFSTHGATYFFEDQLPIYGDAPSFFEILCGSDSLFEYLKVDNGGSFFYFIPSMKQVTETVDEFDFLSSQSVKEIVKRFVQIVSKEPMREYYLGNAPRIDIIIFDCQAGSSSILPSLLPNVDTTLMVLEPDKVSSSALRSIYTKTSPFLSEKNVFQVFNKVDEKEKEFYEKVTFGTFFVNVGALLYDWSIRKAFAFSYIPDVENEGVDYGIQICQLCQRIIVDSIIRSKVNNYQKQLQLKKETMELALVEEELSNYQKVKKALIIKIGFAAIVTLLIMVYVYFKVYGDSIGNSYSPIADAIFSSMTAGLLSGLIASAIVIIGSKIPETNGKELTKKKEKLENDISVLKE